MFCNASVGANDEQKQKLDKLLKLWESKANYLAAETVDKMRQPTASYQRYQSDQVNRYAAEVANLAQQTKSTFEGYRAQHQAFVCHAMQQIMDLQQQKQNLEPLQPPPAPPQPPAATTANIIPLDAIQANLQQTIQTQFPQPPPTAPDNFMPAIDPTVPPPNIPPPPQPPNGMDVFSKPPPGFFPPPGVFPDFSRPPPGFQAPPPQIQKPDLEELTPTVPYYDLPAGLIVPLIKVSMRGGISG